VSTQRIQQQMYVHCKFLPHENYGDWKLRGPCRENLHYLWIRAVRIAGKPSDNYRSCNYHGVSPAILTGTPQFPIPAIFMG
jgi:hypothetical protein